MFPTRLLFTLAILFVPLIALAQKDAPPVGAVSAEDRARAVKYFEDTRAAFLAAIKPLSEAQWKFKQAPDRWSVAETAEHITAVEEALFGLVTTQVMKTPLAEPAKPADAKAKDEMVVKGVSSRDTKVKAPEAFQPTGRYPSREVLLSTFEEGRSKVIDYMRSSSEPMRAHFMDSPVIKAMDGYQWMLFLAAHSERHTKQILEVKADPAFPRS